MEKDDNNFSKQFEEFNQKMKNQNEELKKEIENLKKEIKEIKEKMTVLENKPIFNWIKYEKHSCCLVLVDSKNKDPIYDSSGGWNCNECKKSYKNQIPNFYCPKCNYDLCLECVGTKIKKIHKI